MVLMVLVGGTLFCAGSSYRLQQVQAEKKQLDQEWKQLTVEKQHVEEQYHALEQVAKQQGQELKGLEEKTNDTLKELEELYERESEIRSQVGLESSEEAASGTAGGDSSPIWAMPLASIQPADFDESMDIVSGNLDVLRLRLSQQFKTYDDLSAQVQAAIDGKAELRNAIVRYALRFVGNRYVYGGTDPNTGADCSGFTGYVMKYSAGVRLNRTAAAQSSQGTSVPGTEVRPGDLVFYGDGVGINHVAIYIGNGKVVHAASTKSGIKISNWKYRSPVKIKNVLGD